MKTRAPWPFYPTKATRDGSALTGTPQTLPAETPVRVIRRTSARALIRATVDGRRLYSWTDRFRLAPSRPRRA